MWIGKKCTDDEKKGGMKFGMVINIAKFYLSLFNWIVKLWSHCNHLFSFKGFYQQEGLPAMDTSHPCSGGWRDTDL